PRLLVLSEISNTEKIINATIEFVDIAGLVKGASKGEGLGNQFLANIRETDAIIHVLRCFEDGNVVHVDGSVDPVRDKEIIDIELQLKDLESIEGRIAKVMRAAKSGDKDAKRDFDYMTRIKEALEQGKSARTVVPANDDESKLLVDLQLLTSKPVLYVCNVEESSVVKGNAHVDRVREAVKDENAEIIV
ncbi:MAG: GTPase, partial [Flavobacteriales bacterium]